MGQHPRPDVVITWLQNDYGQLGRPSEAVARALVDEGLARRVAYVEPSQPREGEPELDCMIDRDLWVYRPMGKVAAAQVAAAVLEHAELQDVLHLNFGVGDANWEFHAGFAPRSRRTALVSFDRLQDWPGRTEQWHAHHARIRHLLCRGSDIVVALSEGSVRDQPEAIYVGHGCDEDWHTRGVDASSEPTDLRSIPHPRVLYFGTLSVRIDIAALAALADSGVEVVLIGLGPSAELAALIDRHAHVHWLGPRLPSESPPYLRHCDLGIVPHTDEPFTWSMEPHKLYNYAAAGLRSVILNCAVPGSLESFVLSTTTVESFVASCHDELGLGPLNSEQIRVARSLSWKSVAHRILDAVDRP